MTKTIIKKHIVLLYKLLETMKGKERKSNSQYNPLPNDILALSQNGCRCCKSKVCPIWKFSVQRVWSMERPHREITAKSEWFALGNKISIIRNISSHCWFFVLQWKHWAFPKEMATSWSIFTKKSQRGSSFAHAVLQMEIPIYTKWTQYIRLKAPRKGSTGPNRWILSNRKKRQEEKRWYL